MLRRGPFPDRRLQRGARRQGRDLADAGRRGDDAGALARPPSRCFGVLLDGRAQPTGIRRRGTDATLLLVLNAHNETVPFRLPDGVGGQGWVCLLDTSDAKPGETGQFAFGDEHPVVGRSLQLFILEPTHTSGQSSAPERSYQHVMQSFDEALAQSLSMPAPKTGEAPPK